jgi:acyl carrier protein
MISDTDALTARIQELLMEALQVERDVVVADLQFGDLPQWDSMGHMEVMLHLEERYGIEINAETIALLTSLPAIREHLLALPRQEKQDG